MDEGEGIKYKHTQKVSLKVAAVKFVYAAVGAVSVLPCRVHATPLHVQGPTR